MSNGLERASGGRADRSDAALHRGYFEPKKFEPPMKRVDCVRAGEDEPIERCQSGKRSIEHVEGRRRHQLNRRHEHRFKTQRTQLSRKLGRLTRRAGYEDARVRVRSHDKDCCR